MKSTRRYRQRNRFVKRGGKKSNRLVKRGTKLQKKKFSKKKQRRSNRTKRGGSPPKGSIIRILPEGEITKRSEVIVKGDNEARIGANGFYPVTSVNRGALKSYYWVAAGDLEKKWGIGTHSRQKYLPIELVNGGGWQVIPGSEAVGLWLDRPSVRGLGRSGGGMKYRRVAKENVAQEMKDEKDEEAVIIAAQIAQRTKTEQYWDDREVEDLQRNLEKLGLDTSGSKQELLSRYREAKKAEEKAAEAEQRRQGASRQTKDDDGGGGGGDVEPDLEPEKQYGSLFSMMWNEEVQKDPG